MPVGKYQDLKAWQAAMELVGTVYRLTSSLPAGERYTLTSQIRRCSISIPSNIAEGHARRSRKEYLHYITIALGSLAELETQLLIARNLGYVSSLELQGCLDEACDVGRMLRGLETRLIA